MLGRLGLGLGLGLGFKARFKGYIGLGLYRPVYNYEIINWLARIPGI